MTLADAFALAQALIVYGVALAVYVEVVRAL